MDGFLAGIVSGAAVALFAIAYSRITYLAGYNAAMRALKGKRTWLL